MKRRGSCVVGLLSLVGAAACAGEPTFPLPMTAARLAAYDSGPALVAYLSQRDASASACDTRARGPHVTGLTAPLREAFVDGLTDGRIDPPLWRACAARLLERAAPEDAAQLLDDVGRAYRSLLKDSDFEKSAAMQRRVEAMQALYLERSHRIQNGHAVLKELFADLRTALAKQRLGPVAARFGAELLEAVDLEQGRWHGAVVDTRTLDALSAQQAEKTLRLFAERLPGEELRAEAERRVVRIHIAASPFDEVRENAAVVEDAVLRDGANVIAASRLPPSRAWLDGAHVPMRGVLVRQDLWAQKATLLGYTTKAPLSVLPDLQLRSALVMDVGGASRPVTLCAPRAELDPSPCVAVGEVAIDSPLAYLDEGGVFRFADDMSMAAAVTLTSMQGTLTLPVNVHGARVASLDWPFAYQRPEDFVLSGAEGGGRGPMLVVRIDHRDPDRYVFAVSSGNGWYRAVVEASDAAAFHLVSRGGRGSRGADGAPGMSGSSGAECESGGNGSNGGDGGSGGPGGDGGDVDVALDCGTASCAPAMAIVGKMVLSLGAPGGAGGAGGQGGSGGSGGSGRSPRTHTDPDGTTVTDDAGCSPGTSGLSGSSGSDGIAGPPGHAGHVTIHVASSTRS